jgi:hypothetical protein
MAAPACNDLCSSHCLWYNQLFIADKQMVIGTHITPSYGLKNNEEFCLNFKYINLSIIKEKEVQGRTNSPTFPTCHLF